MSAWATSGQIDRLIMEQRETNVLLNKLIAELQKLSEKRVGVPLEALPSKPTESRLHAWVIPADWLRHE